MTHELSSGPYFTKGPGQPWSLAVVVLAVLLVGCSDDAIPTPTATPDPLLMVMDSDVLSSEIVGSIWLGGPTQGAEPEIPVAVRARFGSGCPVYRLDATLTFDPNVLRYSRHELGDYFAQGGTTPTATVVESSDRLTIQVSRPTNAAPVAVSGTGTVLRLYFRLAPTASAGNVSPLAWSRSALLRAQDFPSGECLNDARDGAVTIRRQ